MVRFVLILRCRYDDRNLESAFVKLSAADYQRKVMPTALLPQQLGNMYTASLYAGLLSLLYSTNEQLVGIAAGYAPRDSSCGQMC